MNNNNLQELVTKLSQGDGTTWSDFFFDIPQAKKLTAILNPDSARSVLAAGEAWNGAGWNTGKASRKLWEAIRVPLVNSDITEYKHAWLYALALSWQVEVPNLVLSDRAGDAAFQLMENILSDAAEENPQVPTPDDEGLEWEQPSVSLPRELLYLWTKAAQGDKLDLASLLQEVPKFLELPTRPPENNGRPSQVDKQLKVVQQLLLHALRLHSATYAVNDPEEARQGLQILWKHLADSYFKVSALRKEQAMPGSTQRDTEQLFSRDDVAQAALTSRIRAMRPFTPFRYAPASSASAPLASCSFRPFRSTRRGDGRGKGSGEGKGAALWRPAFRHGAKGKGKGRGKAPPSDPRHGLFLSQGALESGPAGTSTGVRQGGEQGVSATYVHARPQPSLQAEGPTAMVAAERSTRRGESHSPWDPSR